jgi:hypothetical protein
MKFFAAALIPLFACLPSTFGQFTFSIAGGEPPAAWQVQDTLTNQVTITFDVSEAAATGTASSDFHIDTEECGDYQDDYSISPTPGLNVQENADNFLVTFTNDEHITATTYCILVKLMIDGMDTPVATKQFTYEVSADATGQDANVQFTMNDLADVTTNSQAGNAADGISGNVDPGLSAASATPGVPVAFGDFFTAQVTPASGFDTEIVGVTIPCGTPVLANNSGRVAYPTKSEVDVTLPVACFADATRAAITITLTVDWWVNNAAVRRLRGLQDTEGFESGYFDYGMEVMIVPLEDGSSGYVTKIYYCASAASAGIAAALLF